MSLYRLTDNVLRPRMKTAFTGLGMYERADLQRLAEVKRGFHFVGPVRSIGFAPLAVRYA